MDGSPTDPAVSRVVPGSPPSGLWQVGVEGLGEVTCGKCLGRAGGAHELPALAAAGRPGRSGARVLPQRCGCLLLRSGCSALLIPVNSGQSRETDCSNALFQLAR